MFCSLFCSHLWHTKFFPSPLLSFRYIDLPQRMLSPVVNEFEEGLSRLIEKSCRCMYGPDQGNTNYLKYDWANSFNIILCTAQINIFWWYLMKQTMANCWHPTLWLMEVQTRSLVATAHSRSLQLSRLHPDPNESHRIWCKGRSPRTPNPQICTMHPRKYNDQQTRTITNITTAVTIIDNVQANR